jgi:HEAT repeat protein
VPEPASPPSGRRLLLALIVSTALVVLAVISGRLVGRRLAPESNGPNSTAPAAVRFVAGQRLVYKMDFDCAVASNFGAIFSDAPSLLMNQLFDASLQSEMSVTVLESDAQHAALVYQFRHPQVQFQAEGQDDPSQSQLIQASLAQPVFCLLDRRGRVESVRFDAAANSMAQRMTCTLLAAMQVVGPEPDANSQAEWEAEEEDPSGKLIAHYQIESDGTIHKTTLRYLQPKPTKKSKTIQLTPTIETQGEDVGTLDAGGSLIALSASEGQSMSFQNKNVGHGVLKLDMQLLRKEEPTPGDLALLRAARTEQLKIARAVRLYDPPSPEQADLNVQREALGNATLESVLAELAVAEEKTLEEKDITQLFLKFKALAVMRPESCSQLGELLIQSKTGSLRMQILADALESAGNAQSQAALAAAVLGRTEDPKAIQLLLPALGAVESPKPQTVDTLLALAFGNSDKNIRTTARLALGNVARSLGDDSPIAARKIVDRIGQELKVAAAAEKWELLLTLGNAGSVDALPTLRRYTDDPAPNLRGAAFWALRWIESPDADDLLTTKALVGDKDFAVRLEAVRALRFRGETPNNIGAQEKALANEAEPQVRIELLGNLWEVRESDPQIKQIVEKAEANDPSDAVREAATKLMEKLQTNP